MTVPDGGRLGDLISKYAILYTYARLLPNASTPLIPKQMHRLLKTKIFPRISIKTYNSENCDKMFVWMNGTTRLKTLDTAAKADNSILNQNENNRYVVDCYIPMNVRIRINHSILLSILSVIELEFTQNDDNRIKRVLTKF